MSTTDDVTEIYISQSHGIRALGYLGAKLAEEGSLPEEFEQPRLLLIWGEALAATMQLDDYSPADSRHFTEAGK